MKALDSIIKVYNEKMKNAYENHKMIIDSLLENFTDEKEYIKKYVQETDRYIQECEDIKSDFVIDSINKLV